MKTQQYIASMVLERRMSESDYIKAIVAKAYDEGYLEAKKECENMKKALKDLIQDLEQRSTWREGEYKGVVDCRHGVYMQAKRALGDFK